MDWATADWMVRRAFPMLCQHRPQLALPLPAPRTGTYPLAPSPPLHKRLLSQIPGVRTRTASPRTPRRIADAFCAGRNARTALACKFDGARRHVTAIDTQSFALLPQGDS